MNAKCHGISAENSWFSGFLNKILFTQIAHKFWGCLRVIGKKYEIRILARGYKVKYGDVTDMWKERKTTLAKVFNSLDSQWKSWKRKNNS